MPPLMRFSPRNKTPKHKSKNKSKSKSKSLSTATKNIIATFTRKKDMQRLFKKVKKIQETKKKVDSFTRKRDTKRSFRTIINYQAANKCSICLQTMLKPVINGPVIKLECEHIFHKECLKNWLINKTQREQTCPLCRTPVTSVDRQSLGLPGLPELRVNLTEIRERAFNIYKDRLRSQIQTMLPQINDLLPLEQRKLTRYEQNLVFFPTHLLQIPRIGQKQLFVKIHELHVEIQQLHEGSGQELSEIRAREYALMEQIVPLLEHLRNQRFQEVPYLRWRREYSVPNLTLEEAENIERLERIICDMARRVHSRAFDRHYEANLNRETRHTTNNQSLRFLSDYARELYICNTHEEILKIIQNIKTRSRSLVTNTINRRLFRTMFSVNDGAGFTWLYPIPRRGEIDLIKRQAHDLVAGIIPLPDPRGIGVVDSHYNDRSDDIVYEIINDIENSPDPYDLENPDIHANGFDFSVVPNNYQSYRRYLNSQNKINETRFVNMLTGYRFGREYLII